MSLSDYAPILYFLALPVAGILPLLMLWVIVRIGVFTWLFLALLMPSTFLIARRIKHGYWHKKGVHHLE